MRPQARFLPLGLLLLAACHSGASQPAATHAAVAEARSVRPDAARLAADVAWLSDDAREGRRAGTEKGREAGEWIAARLAALGLEPAGERGTFLQEFEVPLEPRTGGGSHLALDGARCDEGPGSLAPLFCAEGGGARGRVEYVGYGIELAKRGWDDWAGRDAKGAVVLVVRGTPQSPPPAPEEAPAAEGEPAAPNPHGDVMKVTSSDPFANAGLVFTKVMTAKRKGAAAVVLLQHPSDAGTPVLAFHEGGSGRAGIPCVTLSWNDARRLFGAALDGWSADLETKPAPAGASGPDAEVVADVVRGHGSAVNVLGVVPGRDRSRTVVLGAHYDHLGWGGTGSLAPGKHEIHNGADDNASGTAAVLEVARILRAGPPPPCDVLVALWSGEELGLLGSEHWVEHPTVPFAAVAGNVNLDMVGRAGNGKLQVLGAGSAAEFPNWLSEDGPQAGLDLTVSASSSPLAGSSDHASFAKRKKPVLHLFSGLHGDYHKPSDDAALFQADGAAKVTELALDLVERMGAQPGIAFVEPKPVEGEKKIGGGFNAWFGSVPNYTFEGPGVKMDGTSPGSPAERAGFLSGDVLLQIGEVKLDNVYDLTYALQYYKPGDVVLVKFQRDGKAEETRVTLAARGLK